MSYIAEHRQKFEDLELQIKNQDQLRRKANGGNSILFCYPPDEEKKYIEEAKEKFMNKAIFVDISKLFVEFVDSIGWDDFAAYYHDYIVTPHVVFNSPANSESDLFKMIISEIKTAADNGKIPVLIRTGCLYGTGIENVNIMEHQVVMGLRHPLVIFYPSKIDNGNLLFLNFKPASKYRGIVVK